MSGIPRSQSSKVDEGVVPVVRFEELHGASTAAHGTVSGRCRETLEERRPELVAMPVCPARKRFAPKCVNRDMAVAPVQRQKSHRSA